MPVDADNLPRRVSSIVDPMVFCSEGFDLAWGTLGGSAGNFADGLGGKRENLIRRGIDMCVT